MRAALHERHAADTQQMHAEHQELLDNPAAVVAAGLSSIIVPCGIFLEDGTRRTVP